MLNTHTRYLHEGIIDYAERADGHVPRQRSSQAMFTCTGSEANDLALRIARFVTGGTGIIVDRHCLSRHHRARSPNSRPRSADRRARPACAHRARAGQSPPSPDEMMQNASAATSSRRSPT